jgi:RHS repeat-associated protein
VGLSVDSLSHCFDRNVVQRWYGPGSGRFATPDPSTGVSAADPGSWNRYSYVQGDPVNFTDSRGLGRDGVDDAAPDCIGDPYYHGYDSCYYFGDHPSGAGAGPTTADRAAAASRATAKMRERLSSRISSLKGSNCESVLAGEDVGLSLETLALISSDLRFYDANGIEGQLTMGDIGLTDFDQASQAVTLSGYADTRPAGTLASTITATSGQGPGGNLIYSKVVLTTGFGNANSTIQDLTLLHEALHYALSMNDQQMFTKFTMSGLPGETPSASITSWLGRDCKNFP